MSKWTKVNGYFEYWLDYQYKCLTIIIWVSTLLYISKVGKCDKKTKKGFSFVYFYLRFYLALIELGQL